MSRQTESYIRRKIKVLEHAEQSSNFSQTCRYFGVSREALYRWRREYEADGDQALINSKSCPENPKIWVKSDIEEKILYLRKHYHFGQLKISGITICSCLRQAFMEFSAGMV